MPDFMDFIAFFLDSLPDFLMSEPFSYMIGLAILSVIVKIILSLRSF